MIPLFKHLWNALWYDEVAAKRWLTGFFLGMGATAIGIMAYPWEVVKAWTVGEWSWRLGAAAAVAIGGMIATGQKNQSPEQIRAIANSPPGATPVPPPGA